MARAIGFFSVAATLTLMACVGDIGSELDVGSNGSGASNSTGTTSGLGAGITTSGTGGCSECTEASSGVGTANPFDTESHETDGVGLDDEGALVLDQSDTNIPGIIWIANTNLGTVTKVDTTTYAKLGRYKIGSVDPSRTSVNSLGDVFVGNRSGNTLTKVSSAGDKCPDTNNDNAITTSTGFDNVLPWGQDDCVMWDVKLPNNPHIRGVAAQDVFVEDPIPDDPDHTKLEKYVWVGGTAHRTVYKFDGETGALLIQTESPTGIYGLALGANAQLWMSGRTDGNSNVLGRVDTNKCFDQASCDAAVVCTRDCTSGVCSCDAKCGIPCDDAAKERILLPASLYGITVDFKGKVWTGGDYIQRYDPQLPEAQRYAAVSGTGFVHGIAADADGWVWGAVGSSGVVRVDSASLAKATVPVPHAKGMAIDKDGKVWAVASGSEAHVIKPGPGINDFTLDNSAVAGLGSCYTYSDMTGLQLALATNNPGYYREVFEGCAEGTEWFELDWVVETAPSTYVRFKARSADVKADLESAVWVSLAKIPSDNPTVHIANAFKAKNVKVGRYLELEVSLQGNLTPDGLVGPKVKSFGVSHHCPGVAN